MLSVMGWLLVLLAGCGKQQPSYEPRFSDAGQAAVRTYVVGIHPLHNPEHLFSVYGPIIEYIDRRIPDVHFELQATRNYEEFERKLDSGHFDFAMPNPYQTVRALDHGYRVFGKMADDQDFRGLILVRKDSPIKNVSDLKGKTVCYPAPTALAATMLPQYYLHTHGVDVNKEIDNRYVGSQESSIMNVYRGHVAAGATWPVPWKAFVRDNPEMAAQLEVKWQTEPLLSNGWVVRKDVPQPVVQQFSRLLFSLQDSVAGRRMLEAIPVTGFVAADENTFAPVLRFLEQFSATVRPLEY